MIITPYNELTGTKMSGGTWSFISGPAGNPAAPGAWNGTLDFTAVVNEGTYIYRYTVTSGSCVVTADLSIEFLQQVAMINDVCATAVTIPLGTVKDEFEASFEGGTMIGVCPTGDATASAVAYPSSWSTSTAVDLWYAIAIPASSTGWEIDFTVDSTAYGVDGIYRPSVAVYDGCTAGDLQNSSGWLSDSTASCHVSLSAPSLLTTLYVRVGAEPANIGQFDVTILGTIGP